MRKICSAVLGLLGFTGNLWANNIQVSDLALVSQNPAEGTVLVQFDLSWENSWRTDQGPQNWDSAWVFAKYRVGTGPWEHASLVESGHRDPLGGEILEVPEKTGVFIHRSENGTGTANFSDVGLRWGYEENGVEDSASIEVKVFAIEMVYVPEGAFWVGDPTSGAENSFFRTSIGIPGDPPKPIPYRIASDGPISVGGIFGLNYGNDNGKGGDQEGPIPESYPVGFNAFYCMKYEVTQGQWVQFFNTLTPTQKEAHDVTGAGGKNSDSAVLRNSISWLRGGGATVSFPDVPLNFVGYANLTAYLDWAGLRMMSELEFEKSCRGPETVVPGEFAWGSESIHTQNYILQNEGLSIERVSNPGLGVGNTRYRETEGGSEGPLRVGIFADSAVTKNREETGASFYGIMELSGNLYERCVTVGTPQGRAFIPNHGDGSLTLSGSADVLGWPGVGHSAYRGGAYPNGAHLLIVGNRSDGQNNADISNTRVGFRGVRSASVTR